MKRRTVMPTVASILLLALGTRGYAQGAYPGRAIRLVVPGPPGNSSDTYARYIAMRMTELLGQPVTVDNKVGGNGIIGATAVLQAPPDGYSIFIAGSSPMAQNLVLFKSLPYDPVKDFRWVSGIFEGMAVLVVSARSPYATLADLVSQGRQRPKQLNYGSYAAAYRLCTEWLNRVAGMQTTLVNYKGAPQIMTDLIGGQIDFAMVDAAAVSPLVQGGQLRALAVTGDKRHPLLAAVPTLQESGLPPYGRSAWVAMAVRAETPQAVVQKLAAAMKQILAEPATVRFSEEQGAFLMPLDDEAMASFHLSELRKYRMIASEADIRPE